MQSLQERFGIHSNLCWKDRSIDIWAYNLETGAGRKLETIIPETTTNTRMRDFLRYLHFRTAAWNHAEPEKFLHDALLANWLNKRGSEKYLNQAEEVFERSGK